jgi:DNA-binding IclR family transcriptional regulator
MTASFHQVGRSLPVFAAASGRVLLADLPAAAQEPSTQPQAVIRSNHLTSDTQNERRRSARRRGRHDLDFDGKVPA